MSRQSENRNILVFHSTYKSIVLYCCWFLKIAYLWSTCLSADCSVYCHKTTERKSLRAPSLESRVIWDPVIKTMVIISEYTLTYQADSGVFCYEQWWHPCLPRLWRYFEVSRYQTTYPEEGRRRERVSYDPQAPLYGMPPTSQRASWLPCTPQALYTNTE